MPCFGREGWDTCRRFWETAGSQGNARYPHEDLSRADYTLAVPTGPGAYMHGKEESRSPTGDEPCHARGLMEYINHTEQALTSVPSKTYCVDFA